MFEENGTVYKTGTLDRLDHDKAYVQVDADADGDTEKEAEPAQPELPASLH